MVVFGGICAYSVPQMDIIRINVIDDDTPIPIFDIFELFLLFLFLFESILKKKKKNTFCEYTAPGCWLFFMFM